MMTLTLYEPSGRIIGYVSHNDVSIPDNVLYVEGMIPADHYIKNGRAYPLPTNPSDEDRIYEFDYEKMQWIIDLPITNTVIRRHRDQKLSVVDQVNPARYAGLSQAQQQELQQYRQHLLDVPQQPGFPESITWPAKPAWL